MTNVISLNVPHRRQRLSERAGALAAVFATHRRTPDDVFWLKENAELLNILECTGVGLPEEALGYWAEFYDTLPKRLSFFPQYYRFFLSIALDLEALGIKGDRAEDACIFVAREDLAAAEFSDLQRAEARRLLARRGHGGQVADAGLDARLHGFMGRSATFSLPNKKAAYELTHIVFYLSEYGRRDPGLSPEAIRSLEYAGVLAVLEQNMDLLAEICVAMRFAGHVPPADWEAQVTSALEGHEVDEVDATPMDDYHEHLVSSWCAVTAGGPATSCAIPDERITFRRPALRTGPLRTLSHTLLSLDRARSGDWQQMKFMLMDAVNDDERAVLQEAEASTPVFDAFFEGFARARA